MARIVGFAVFAVFAFAVSESPVAGAEKEWPKSITPANAKDDCRLLCVTDKWAVWQTKSLIESTKGFRAESYNYAFYIQKLADAEAKLIATERDVSVTMLGTVTDDGVFVLGNRNFVSWRAMGKPVVTEEARVFLLALYPDGALFHNSTGLMLRPVEFVPFKNNRLNLDARIELATPVLSDVGVFDSRRGIVRHKNQFAILTEHPERKDNKKPPGVTKNLYCFDLETKKSQLTKLSAALHPSYFATAFDGDTVTSYHVAFDTKTGKLLGSITHPDDGKQLREVFAIRNRIGYFIRDNVLYATDLASEKLPTVRVCAAPKQTRCAITDTGLVVWNGKAFETVAWLKTWPK